MKTVGHASVPWVRIPDPPNLKALHQKSFFNAFFFLLCYNEAMILVTGLAGYIGSHCALALLEKGQGFPFCF